MFNRNKHNTNLAMNIVCTVLNSKLLKNLPCTTLKALCTLLREIKDSLKIQNLLFYIVLYVIYTNYVIYHRTVSTVPKGAGNCIFKELHSMTHQYSYIVKLFCPAVISDTIISVSESLLKNHTGLFYVTTFIVVCWVLNEISNYDSFSSTKTVRIINLCMVINIFNPFKHLKIFHNYLVTNNSYFIYTSNTVTNVN